MLSTLKQPKAILLDWDNTLIDTRNTLYEAANKSLSDLGFPPLSPEEAEKSMSMSPADTFKFVYKDKAAEGRKLFYHYIDQMPLDRLTPLPGAMDFIRTAHQQNIKLGVVSNKTGHLLRREIEHFELGEYLVSVVGAGDAQEDKPSPAPALKALEDMSLPPNLDVWLVGDNIVDWQCASQAGIQPICIWRCYPEGVTVPERTISTENFENLKKILKN